MVATQSPPWQYCTVADRGAFPAAQCSLLEAQVQQVTSLYRAQMSDTEELRSCLSETLLALESANADVASAEAAHDASEQQLRVSSSSGGRSRESNCCSTTIVLRVVAFACTLMKPAA